jgi:predicted GH43/DUF377 family glycosyl hydrolase
MRQSVSTYIETLRTNYLAAFNQEIREEITGLTETQFIEKYEPKKSWAIGPFSKNDQLTFRKTVQMPDPTGIGWTSSSIFNPSIIEHNGALYLFYRAAVKKESLGSRIGLAIYSPETGWQESSNNPIIFPTEENEILSVEDPKVYKYGENKFIMFYNGAWAASVAQIAEFDKPYGEVSVDIKYALSSDLINWEKQGLAVPYSVSKLWAKGAVISRDQDGSAVKINGKYLMFLSEGCGGKQVVGNSTDMISWQFDEVQYLSLPKEMGTHIYEVACAVVDGDNLILDFMYNSHQNEHLGSQVRYAIDKPFEPLEFTTNATLAWGGMIKYQGNWCFAQGWDAPRNTEEIYFYTT